MKKIINKLFLLCALVSLTIPVINVYAEEIGTGSSGGESTVGGEVTPTPSTSPEPTASPTPEVNKKEAKLDSLEIAGYKFTESFSKDKTSYKLTVKSDVKNVVINATAKEGVTVVGTGSQSLSEGANEFSIVAKTEDETTTYTIKITRSTSDLSLKILSITGHPLNETFDPSILDYTADVSYDTQSVIIKAGTNNSDATQQISGNSNLKVGKNTVRIIVKNSSGEQQEYRIIVNRASEEIEEDDDTTSIISSEEVTSSITSDINKTNDDNNKTDTLKYVLVVIFCILLLIIASLGIYFYIRTGNSEKRKQKRIEKLKKKQAKIEEELTSLLPVITDEIIEENYKLESQETKEYNDNDFEDTIELEDFNVEEVNDEKKPKKRVGKSVLDDFDDLFLDDEDE